jgi:RNA polymerase sigma-70 factor (ECF subfamily)
MGAETITDADLSRRCRQGDPGAWRLLIRRLGPLVYRVAVRMVGPGAEAEDASQETFMRIHRSFDRFDPTRPLAPWAARICYNVCLSKLGRAATKAGRNTDAEALARLGDERAPGPEHAAASSESGAIVTRALERLAAQDRVLIDLRYREELTDAEVAEALGMPVGTVKTRLHRARAKLKRVLAPIFRAGAR